MAILPMSSAWNPSVTREAPCRAGEVLEGSGLQAATGLLDRFLADIIALAGWPMKRGNRQFGITC